MLKFYCYKILCLFHLISKKQYKKSIAKYTRDYCKVLKSGLFDANYYLSLHPEVLHSGMDAIQHYLAVGYKKGFNPSRFFDGNLYLQINSDIKKAGINPLLHWLYYGRREKRLLPIINSENKTLQNNGNYDVLLFSHELSLTGAPIALFNLALALKEQKCKVLVLSPQSGDLEKELHKAKIDYIVDNSLLYRILSEDEETKKFFDSFQTLFFNTVGTLRYACHISSSNRKICWIHEGSQGYDWAEKTII